MKIKKHIRVILSCILAVMVAISSLLIIDNSTSIASADSVNSSEYLVVLPEVSFKYRDSNDCVMPAQFFSVFGDTILFYQLNAYKDERGFYNAYTYDIGTLTELHNQIHYVSRFLDDTGRVVTKFKNIGYISYIFCGGDFSRINQSNVISVSRVTYDSIGGYGIRYLFQDVRSSVTICYIDLVNFDSSLEFFYDNDYFNYTTIAAPLDASDLDKYMYDSGYQRGLVEGYQSGYDKGLSTTWKDLSPWQVLVNGVNDFLDARFFGTVSFRLLFMCGMGVMLVLLLFKLVK